MNFFSAKTLIFQSILYNVLIFYISVLLCGLSTEILVQGQSFSANDLKDEDVYYNFNEPQTANYYGKPQDANFGDYQTEGKTARIGSNRIKKYAKNAIGAVKKHDFNWNDEAFMNNIPARVAYTWSTGMFGAGIENAFKIIGLTEPCSICYSTFLQHLIFPYWKEYKFFDYIDFRKIVKIVKRLWKTVNDFYLF